ncbi:MAG: FAD-dependent oxidoreductase [Pseudolabrys sp.]|jgi:3-phenylpropionate/trans-cinnamate dioxygenase ferredoxin reductase subunit
MRSAGTVIVGAGQGGYQVAASLRDSGYSDPIHLIGEEAAAPYQRPPLSKAYLLGEMSADRLSLRPLDFYRQHDIELVTGVRVTSVDRASRHVAFANGTALAYDHLVLATGARNRKLPVEGAELDNVLYMRTIDDANSIQARFSDATNIVVVGAGFIGLELAAVASKRGKQVAVVEALPRCMSRAVTPVVSQFYADMHAEWGNRLLFGAQVARLEGKAGKVEEVVLDDGRRLPADLVLVGIGVQPAVELAVEAGLPAQNGILVSALLLTADPAISAIGDCAAFPDTKGVMTRLESVQNAVDQGRCVAKRIAGQPAPYNAIPWFWSDQRDLKLQMVGLTAGCDATAVRGSVAEKAFSVFCFRGNALIGIESVNKGADHMFGRKILAAGESISCEEAADPGFDLKARLAGVKKSA